MKDPFRFMVFPLFLFLPSLSGAQTTDSLTVDRAIEQVINNHPLVQQASEAVQASIARVEQSRSAYYPGSDVSLGYVRLGPVSMLAFPGLGEFKLFGEDNWDEHVGIKQTVYDFGKTSAVVDANLSNVELATNNIELVKTNLAFQTIQAFYAMLFLREAIQVQDSQIEALNQHLLITEKKVQAGTATSFEILTTQVRIAAAQNREFDFQNDLQKEEAIMRRLLGLPAGTELHLRGEFRSAAVQINTDSLIALAKRQRVELRQSFDAEKTAELQAHAVSLRDMPALKVNLAYGLKNGYFPDMDVLRGNWIAGVEADIPVFNGYRTRSEEEEAQAGVHVAQARTRDTERLIQAEVQQAVSDLETNTEKIQTSTLQVEQAKQALEIANSRYESGVITNLDLIDAQTALSMAQLVHLEALHQFVISRYALAKAVGESLFEH